MHVEGVASLHHRHGAEPGVGQVGERGGGQACPASSRPAHIPALQCAPERAPKFSRKRVVEDRINCTVKGKFLRSREFLQKENLLSTLLRGN